MGRGRAARRGQKPAAPRARPMRGRGTGDRSPKCGSQAQVGLDCWPSKSGHGVPVLRASHADRQRASPVFRVGEDLCHHLEEAVRDRPGSSRRQTTPISTAGVRHRCPSARFAIQVLPSGASIPSPYRTSSTTSRNERKTGPSSPRTRATPTSIAGEGSRKVL